MRHKRVILAIKYGYNNEKKHIKAVVGAAVDSAHRSVTLNLAMRLHHLRIQRPGIISQKEKDVSAGIRRNQESDLMQLKMPSE